MPGVSQGDQRVDVEQVPHGKSSRAARMSSLVTFVSAADFVMHKPDFGSLIRRGCSATGCSGVSTIECPCTLQTNFTPARRCKRIRACLGSTTWPLLDRVTVMSYSLTLTIVGQTYATPLPTVEFGPN